MSYHRMTGRAPYLERPEIRRELLAALRLGATYKDAAHSAGVGEAVVKLWLHRGRLALAAIREALLETEYDSEAAIEFLTLPLPPKEEAEIRATAVALRQVARRPISKRDELYLCFLRDAERARSQARIEALQTLRRHSVGDKDRDIRSDWRAAAFLLERTDPENYGRRVTHRGDRSAPIKHAHAHIHATPSDLAKMSADELLAEYRALVSNTEDEEQ